MKGYIEQFYNKYTRLYDVSTRTDSYEGQTAQEALCILLEFSDNEDSAIDRIIKILEFYLEFIDFQKALDELFHNDKGLAYIILFKLSNLGIINYGVSIRLPHLTDYGKKILIDLQTHF